MKTIEKGKKITLAVILMLTLLFSLTASQIDADALSTSSATGQVSISSAALRKSASNGGKKITTLKKNTAVTITKEVFSNKKSTSSKNRWYYVKANGRTGYIRSDHVKNISYTAVKGKATAKTKARKGAGSKMSTKGIVKKGGTMQIVLAAKASGSSTTWYKIKWGSTYYYVSAKTVKLVAPEPVKFSTSKLRYPSKLTEGQAFTIKGKVTCNYNMSKGVVRVLDQSGKEVMKTEIAMNSKTFDINKADKKTTFGKLPAGNYTYLVDVYYNGNGYNQVNKTFVVQPKPEPEPEPEPAPAEPAQTTDPAADPAQAETGTADPAAAQNQAPEQGSTTAQTAAAATPAATSSAPKFTVTELRCPEKLYVGAAFTIKGKISCDQTISKGVVRVTNSSGQQVLYAELAVNGKEFNILNIDKQVKFGSLGAGNYNYYADVVVNGKTYNQVAKTFVVQKAAKAERITNKAFDLAWPVGTSSSKYKYNGGSPTAAYRYALESAYPNRSKWGAAPKVGASCDVFVGTVLRSCGVDGSAPRGLSEQFPYFKGSSKYTRVSYSGKRSELRSGDIVMFTRNAGNTHICLYLVKNGKEYIAEANYQSTYGMLVSDSASINSKLKLGDKKRMEIYRIVE